MGLRAASLWGLSASLTQHKGQTPKVWGPIQSLFSLARLAPAAARRAPKLSFSCPAPRWLKATDPSASPAHCVPPWSCPGPALAPRVRRDGEDTWRQEAGQWVVDPGLTSGLAGISWDQAGSCQSVTQAQTHFESCHARDLGLGILCICELGLPVAAFYLGVTFSQSQVSVLSQRCSSQPPPL